MHQTTIPMPKVREKHKARTRRSGFDGARAVEIYFAILTILIIGLIVGIGAYAVNFLLPAWERQQSEEWQRSHFPGYLGHSRSNEFLSHPREVK